MFLSAAAIRKWSLVHKWTSLISTIFLLMLCITGLPLIFYHEVESALGYTIEPPELPGVTSTVTLDQIVEAARAHDPAHVIQYVSREDDEKNAWFVAMGETAQGPSPAAFYMFDARTGEFLHEYPLEQGVMNVLLRIHYDMFAGLPGALFLGFMGLLLVASLVSGTVLYGPFMRKLRFGSVRHDRSPRIRWLDLHNLLGIATLIWLCTVGVTGVINTLAVPIYEQWQTAELAAMSAPYKGAPPVTQLSSLDQVAATARRAVPDSDLSFIAFPGNEFATPHHYAAFMQGSTPLTSKLLIPVLIDAQTGELIDRRTLPWSVTALLISQPLHYGNYGGLPLKILWALLDLIAIVVLASGVYLWIKKRNLPIEARLGLLQTEGA